MKGLGLTFALVAALALPATAAGHNPGNTGNPSKRCKAERGEPGGSALRRAFASRNEHGRCVSERAKLKRRLVSQAVRECRAELAEDPAAFEEKYGSLEARNEDGEEHPTKAFPRCVRQKVKAALEGLHEDLHNAAKECKAERADDPDAFRDKYGRNRNKRNALGKCVSEHVRDGDEPEPGAEEKPRPVDDTPGEVGGTTGDGEQAPGVREHDHRPF